MNKIFSSLIFSLTILFIPYRVSAHGFGERYDLPIPLNYFLIGSSVTIIVSFILIGIFVKQKNISDKLYKEFNYTKKQNYLLRTFTFNKFSKIIQSLLKIISVTLFLITILSGAIGIQEPYKNFSVTFVWIIWWVGMGYINSIIGDIWNIINPWKVIFEFTTSTFRLNSYPPIFKYPKKLDAWPSVILFLLFAWTENIYDASTPYILSRLIIGYSILTWTGMFLFGKHQWIEYADPFSKFFKIMSKFSISEIKLLDLNNCKSCEFSCLENNECIDCYSCQEASSDNNKILKLRLPGFGLTKSLNISISTSIFILCQLSTVSFDGIVETPFWVKVQNYIFDPISLLGPNIVSNINTLGLILFPIFFIMIYYFFTSYIYIFSNKSINAIYIFKIFTLSLIPIALAYHFAHYLSYILIQGQLIIPLLSDPFGKGLNLFGSSNYSINISVINAKTAWFISLISIISGHIISILVGHIIALKIFKTQKIAIRSQYPMLFLMVFYTALSLWIIAQPIVEN